MFMDASRTSSLMYQQHSDTIVYADYVLLKW